MPLFTGVEGVTTARVVVTEEMLVAVGSTPMQCSGCYYIWYTCKTAILREIRLYSGRP